ncbi:MAG TPA: prephenate dehydrogenase [Candidatus Pseudogracilibacillus intestinigallinarum]|uniref:Prephenate dehydrogenase n=1 Tax=Candidatus Pseudogracilibacillus intestinigallinarum TaxID=2838742 RepID=A0A9D1PMB5_9BACI|nr:prephenate dehydrogenase [Candidatus Pseudogracilibacillus intestinigallinarum]
MKKILVAGLGLIGGSIAKALNEVEGRYVIGYDVNEASLQYAKETGMISESETDFETACKKAEIIILAAPISATIQLMEKIAHISFDHPVIVTDVSSVKGSILQTSDRLVNDQVTFIGGHPMAGSHKTGVEAAKEHLFENAIYVLTPPTDCAKQKVDTLKEVLAPTKCNFIILEPNEHDEMTSVISHFPHLIASSLVHQARKWEQVHEYLPELAAGGFRDITRIASSNPKMWQDIFQHNGQKMSKLLQDWINEMVTLKEFLDKNSSDEMIQYLDQAKQYRDGLGEKKTRGALPSFYDMYVDVKDEPGSIAKVVQLLANASISLKNIRILEIRDNVNGALRLSVTTEKDRQRAVTLLKENDYEVTVE